MCRMGLMSKAPSTNRQAPDPGLRVAFRPGEQRSRRAERVDGHPPLGFPLLLKLLRLFPAVSLPCASFESTLKVIAFGVSIRWINFYKDFGGVKIVSEMLWVTFVKHDQ